MSFNLQTFLGRESLGSLRWSLENFPVTAILGPRQCGKSTLARHLLQERPNALFLDLEKPSDFRKLEDAEFFFAAHADKLVCIDEAQILPHLFPVIRASVDEKRLPGRFLILGSASPELIQKSSETLAGRIHHIALTPFTYSEVLSSKRSELQKVTFPWVRGGFPESLLAKTEKVSFEWRMDFIRTFLERDIPRLGVSIPALTLRRFWTMLAHYHGQVLNASKLGQALGVSHVTLRHYVDLLENTFMVRVLPPLEANLKKRLIKSPKIYLRDSGLLHALLELENLEALLGHPVSGASWEGWCVEQIASSLPDWRASFYRTSSGEEVDLLLEKGKHRFAFEFKSGSAPQVSRGFKDTLTLLKPEKTWVVAPIEDRYPLRAGAVVCSLREVLQDLQPYRQKY